ncbi:hypothetical protein ACP6L2_05810 [Sphingobacterium lactis]|uniref:hypothetical protein n=1 Tax=Sphingobacterium lactis TaxID=797291 RepID=UPI003F812DF9
MKLPILDYNKIYQVLREDISFFIKEDEIHTLSIESLLKEIIEKIESKSDSNNTFEIVLDQHLGPYSYKVYSNGPVLYILRLLLFELQKQFGSFSSLFDLYIIENNGGIITKHDFDLREPVNKHLNYISVVVGQDKDRFEKLVDEIKDPVSHPFFDFKKSNLNTFN